jgi:hypothetical protein
VVADESILVKREKEHQLMSMASLPGNVPETHKWKYLYYNGATNDDSGVFTVFILTPGFFFLLTLLLEYLRPKHIERMKWKRELR